MFDVSALSSILSTRNGVWTLVALVILGLWRGWQGLPAFMAALLERRKAIAAEKEADWTRIRAEVTRYVDRLAAVERHDEECQRQLNEALRRLAEVEGYMMGQGKARQDAATIVATERLLDRDKEGGK